MVPELIIIANNNNISINNTNANDTSTVPIVELIQHCLHYMHVYIHTHTYIDDQLVLW